MNTSTTIETFFNTRSAARTYALNNGLKTSDVIDYSKTKNVTVGTRWAVKVAGSIVSCKTRSKLSLVRTGAGFYNNKPQRIVSVVTKKTRKFELKMAA